MNAVGFASRRTVKCCGRWNSQNLSGLVSPCFPKKEEELLGGNVSLAGVRGLAEQELEAAPTGHHVLLQTRDVVVVGARVYRHWMSIVVAE